MSLRRKLTSRREPGKVTAGLARWEGVCHGWPRSRLRVLPDNASAGESLAESEAAKYLQSSRKAADILELVMRYISGIAQW